MWWVLIVTFIYFGPAYLIAVWNLRETSKKVDEMQDSFFFAGIYTDLTSEWFNDIGVLVASTAVINSFFSIIEFAGFLLIRVVKRCIDQKSCFPRKKHDTRAKTMPQFEFLYSGPLFFVHYRLAGIVNLVWITFFFGAGQPILFPITLGGLIVQYISERLRMAYSYQKPPMYDSRLTSKTLSYLGVAPFLYALYACWLFSNQQVFQNTVTPIIGFNLYPLQEHKFA